VGMPSRWRQQVESGSGQERARAERIGLGHDVGPTVAKIDF